MDFEWVLADEDFFFFPKLGRWKDHGCSAVGRRKFGEGVGTLRPPPPSFRRELMNSVGDQ